jgi:hypothetical protein
VRKELGLLLPLKIRFELLVQYNITCLLVQKYLLTITELAACSYKTRSMFDEMTV